MSVNVIVSGLPREATITRLIFPFKGMFKKININKFWIRELSVAYGDNHKQMTVEFTSHADARKARTFLNNLPFSHGEMVFYLQAELGEEAMEWAEEEEQWEQPRRPAKRQRQRSPSPGYSREASKLDMEIELLRKQRQVIEEERRLLLEQKKLEMIKEYGPSAAREFNDFDTYDSYESYEPPRKKRQPESVQAKKPRKKSPPPPAPKLKNYPKGPKGLPTFFQPCRRLIGDMKPYIQKDTTSEEAEILVKLIRAALRKNLALALEGKDYMPTGEILKLYRQRHPKENDEAFVNKILTNVRASLLIEVKVEKDEVVDAVKVKEESVVEDQTGDTKDKEKVADEERAKDEVALQDAPTNEENGIDTAAPDVDIKVDVSQELEQDSAANLSTEVTEDAGTESNDISVLNNMLVLDEIEAEKDVLGEGEAEPQSADDWVEEQ